MGASRILLAGTVALLTAACTISEARTIKFSGYDWTVRAGRGGPGPNNWDENNVWVDQSGYLHLQLTSRGNQWYASEVSTTDRLGFGRYQFWVIGRLDRLDPNIVFGLFNYPTPDLGPDGTNEIDIEFSQWANPEAPMGNYTVWPTKKELVRASHRFPVELSGDYSTHKIIWNSTSVSFQSLHGHRDDNSSQFGEWLYQPRDPSSYVSQKPMPFRINLWCFRGQPPKDGQQVEIVIRSFKFTPQ